MTPPNPRGGSPWPGATDLTTDRWTLTTQQAARSDDRETCASRLLAMLQGLASLDPTLARWQHHDEPVTLDGPHLASLLYAGRDTEDPSGELGSKVLLWNGNADRNARAELLVECGSSTSTVSDGIGFELPRPVAAPRLYQAETMLAMCETVIAAWQPQWCAVRPFSLRRATGSLGKSLDVLASWVLYLDRSIYRRVGALPTNVRSIGRHPEGEIFILAPAPADLTMATIDGLRGSIRLADEWAVLR